MKTIIGVTLAIVIGLITSLIWRLGGFKDVAIHTEVRPSMTLLYKHHVGAYHKIVPVIEEVEAYAKLMKFDCAVSFGEYLDDPDAVAEDRLRSNGGCVTKMLTPKELPDGFKLRRTPEHQFIVAEFDGAPSIGPMKVYPRVRDEIAKSGAQQSGPTFELYEIREGNQVHTTYLFPIVPRGTIDSAPISE